MKPWRCRRTDGRKWRCSNNVAPDEIYCERHLRKICRRSTKHVKPSQNVVQSDTTKTITETFGTSSSIGNTENITINTSKSKTTASANGIRTRSKTIVDANIESTDYVKLSSDDICPVTDTTSITALTEKNGSKKNNNDVSKDTVNKHNMNSTNNGSNCKSDGSDKPQKKKIDSALLSQLEKAVGDENVNPSELRRKRRLVTTLTEKEDCSPKKAHVGDLPIHATEPLHNVAVATASDAELFAFSLEALKTLRVSTAEIVRRSSAQEADLTAEKKKTQEANRVEQLENELNTLRDAHKILADKADFDKLKLGQAQEELVREVARREAAEKACKDLRTAQAEEVRRLKAEQVVDLKQSLIEEFSMGFFSGYQDLKDRALSDHPEWDLSIYDPNPPSWKEMPEFSKCHPFDSKSHSPSIPK